LPDRDVGDWQSFSLRYLSSTAGGLGLPDFLLGDVDGVHFTTPLVVHYFQPGHSFYAMDTWKTTPKLTLTYGLRYELLRIEIKYQYYRRDNSWNYEAVKVTKGEGNIGVYHKTETSYRKFCKICGGHLLTDHPPFGLIDVYAATTRRLVFTRCR